MPPIEIGPTRPVGAIDASVIDARAVRAAAGESAKTAKGEAASAKPSVSFQRSEALDPGEPLIDIDRVAKIRKAVEQGTYPVIPTKIADAMIAAGYLLRTQQ